MRDEKSGIYLIHNIINNKFYIGSSINISSRWKTHRYDLKANTHHNTHLQGAYNIHGKNSFSFSILEECIKEQFKERESYWIRFYDSVNPDKGYNIDIPDQVNYPETKNERIIIENPIVSISKVTKEVKEFINIGICSRGLNVPKNKIEVILNYWENKLLNVKPNYIKIKSCKDFIFVRKEHYNKDFNYIEFKTEGRVQRKKRKQMEPRSTSERAMKRRGELPKEIRTKRIIAINISSNVEVIYDSIIDCITTLGLNKSKVYECLNDNTNTLTHKGYSFRRL